MAGDAFAHSWCLFFVLFVARVYAHIGGYKMFLFSQQSSVSPIFHVFSSRKFPAVVTPISRHAHFHLNFHDFFHYFSQFRHKICHSCHPRFGTRPFSPQAPVFRCTILAFFISTFSRFFCHKFSHTIYR